MVILTIAALASKTELAESIRQQHQTDIDEVIRQKSDADAEIVTLKNMLQQNEVIIYF